MKQPQLCIKYIVLFGDDKEFLEFIDKHSTNVEDVNFDDNSCVVFGITEELRKEIELETGTGWVVSHNTYLGER